jgi:hypothetical protein
MTALSEPHGLNQQSPSSTSDTRKDDVFRFNDLPMELKLMVLKARLVVANPITPLAHYVHAKQRLVPLASISKALKQLAYETYYKCNNFVAQASKIYPHPDDYVYARPSFKYPNPELGAWIQDLTVKLTVSLSWFGTALY